MTLPLHAIQGAILRHPARRKVVVTGRRFGKTYDPDVHAPILAWDIDKAPDEWLTGAERRARAAEQDVPGDTTKYEASRDKHRAEAAAREEEYQARLKRTKESGEAGLKLNSKKPLPSSATFLASQGLGGGLDIDLSGALSKMGKGIRRLFTTTGATGTLDPKRTFKEALADIVQRRETVGGQLAEEGRLLIQRIAARNTAADFIEALNLIRGDGPTTPPGGRLGSSKEPASPVTAK